MMSSIVKEVIYASAPCYDATFAMSIRLSICWCDFDSSLISSVCYISPFLSPSFQKLWYEIWPKSDNGFSGDPTFFSILLSS